jgi:hypothetical protein
VTLTDIAVVKVKCLVVVDVICAYYPQVLIALQDSSLPAPGCEFSYRDASGNAGIAMRAVRSIDMIAAAAETQYRKFTVEFLVDRLSRIDEQGSGFLVIQVAAAVGVGSVYLEIPQG